MNACDIKQAEKESKFLSLLGGKVPQRLKNKLSSTYSTTASSYMGKRGKRGLCLTAKNAILKIMRSTQSDVTEGSVTEKLGGRQLGRSKG